MPGLRLALTTDSWVALLGLTDFIGRRILSSVNPGNTDGSSLLIDESVNVGGIVAFHSPMSTVDLMFNDKALRVAEKPPMQLTVDSVALMGRDIGVLGATIALPLYPGGVVKFTA